MQKPEPKHQKNHLSDKKEKKNPQLSKMQTYINNIKAITIKETKPNPKIQKKRKKISYENMHNSIKITIKIEEDQSTSLK